MKNISIPISIGELIDKITILEIKKNQIQGSKLINIKKELSQLEIALKNSQILIDQELLKKLKKINSELWSIEDKIKHNYYHFYNQFSRKQRDKLYKKLKETL